MGRTRAALAHAIEAILLTAWVGGLWTIGYLAAPALFAALPDQRPLAGTLAAHLFVPMSYLGLGCGLVLLGLGFVTRRDWLRQWQAWAIVLMLIITVVGEFVLLPAIQSLRIAADGPLVPGHPLYVQFSRLHGGASILFLLNSLLGLAVVVARSRVQRGHACAAE